MDLQISPELETAAKQAAKGLGSETSKVMLDPPFQDFAVVTEHTDQDSVFASFTGEELGRSDVPRVFLVLLSQERSTT